MQKVELTKHEALLVMRILNYFLAARSNNAIYKCDVAGAKDLKNNLFRRSWLSMSLRNKSTSTANQRNRTNHDTGTS